MSTSHEYFVSFFSIDALGLPHFSSLGMAFTAPITLADIPNLGSYIREQYQRTTGREATGFSLLAISPLGSRDIPDTPTDGAHEQFAIPLNNTQPIGEL